MPYLTRRHRPTVQPKGAYRLAPNVLAALIGGDANPQRLTVLPPQGSLLNQREGVAYYNSASASSGTFGDVNAPLHTGSVTIFVMGWWMWGGTVTFRLGSSNGVSFAKHANNGRFTITPVGYSFNPATLNSYTFSANPTFRKVVGHFDLGAAEARGWSDNGTSDAKTQTGSYSIPANNTAPLAFGSSSLDRVQVAVIFAGIISPWELFSNPWGWVRPVQRARTYFFPSAGGGITLTIDDATHGHTADGLSLTQQHQLAVQDATHAHAVDNLALTQQHQLAIADATHAHAADNLTLSTELTLSIADALHAHIADGVALTQAHVLAVADALHAHAADGVDLQAGITLSIAEAVHGHLVDNLGLTQAHVLAILDAFHAHTVDNITFPSGAPRPFPTIWAVAAEVRRLRVPAERRLLQVKDERRHMRVH